MTNYLNHDTILNDKLLNHDTILNDKLLNHDLIFFYDKLLNHDTILYDKLLNAICRKKTTTIAKSINKGQPARTAHAYLNRYFLQMH